MLDENTQDSFFENYKKLTEKKYGWDEQIFLQQIKQPEFTEAFCKLVIDIVNSNLYQEIFGKSCEQKLYVDDRYGYHEIDISLDNEKSNNSHNVSFDMKHLYAVDSYSDDPLYVDDIGSFNLKDVGDIKRLSGVSEHIYNDLIDANIKNPYYSTFKNINTAQELMSLSKFEFFDSNENPFYNLQEYARNSGLNYMDTSNDLFSEDLTKHKAVVLNSPIGPLAYLHFKSISNEVFDDNIYCVSSIGVIPPLRQKGISKKLYELANESLGFNDKTIIHRTTQGSLSPDAFTSSIPNIVKNHKPLYLNHELTRFNYNKIEGFSSLPRKKKVSEIRKINDDVNSLDQNELNYYERNLKIRDMVLEMEKKIKKIDRKNKKNMYI